jgi:hypothetical protein
MKNLNNTATSSIIAKKTYVSPKVEKVKLDNEISMVMMSQTTPPTEGGPSNFPSQDPLMSLKAFKLFK